METAAQKCARLLSALEDLSGQEQAALYAEDFATVLKIQGRAAPLVEYLGQHGPAVADARFRNRVGDYLRQRAAMSERLASRIAEVKVELAGKQVSQARVARLAPVYGTAGMAAPRNLQAVG
jgi:hypothetical protein